MEVLCLLSDHNVIQYLCEGDLRHETPRLIDLATSDPDSSCRVVVVIQTSYGLRQSYSIDVAKWICS